MRSLWNSPAIAWGAGGALACGLAVPLEPSLLEEGILLHVAERLAAGEHLYRDVLAFTGPLPFELLGLLFRIFGENVWIGRVLVVALHGISTGLAFALARSGRAGSAGHVAAAIFAAAPFLLFPLYSLYYYTTIAFHLSLLASWAASRGRTSATWAAAAGAAVACVALSKQSIGVALAATLGIALLAQTARLRRSVIGLAYVGGGLAVAAVSLAAFAATGGVTAFVEGAAILPLSLDDSFSSPYPNLWPLGQFSDAIAHNQRFYLPYLYSLLQKQVTDPGAGIVLFTQLLYALPLAAVALPIALRLRGRRPSAESWIHLALVVGWLSNLFPRADWGHLAHVLPFAAVQLALSLGGGTVDAEGVESDDETPHSRAGWVAIAALLIGALLAGATLYRRAEAPTFGPRVPLRAVSQAAQNPATARVIQYLRARTEPGEAIFVARAEPLLYFATHTTNPTPYPGVIPGMRETQQETIVRALEQTRYVVMSDVDQPSMTYYRDELPRVQAVLERHFHIPEIFLQGRLQWISVLERGHDRGETVIDLIAEAPRARAFVVGTDRREEPVDVLPQRLATFYNRRPLGFELGSHGGGIEFELEIPEGAVFQGSVGLRRIHDHEVRYRHPPASELTVSVESDDGRVVLGRARAMEGANLGTAWTELDASLDAFAGRRVTLRLALTSEAPIPEGAIGWWGSPRIARESQ